MQIAEKPINCQHKNQKIRKTPGKCDYEICLLALCLSCESNNAASSLENYSLNLIRKCKENEKKNKENKE